MSLLITKRPILDDADGTFRWNSVENPVNYELQREDVQINFLADVGGFLQVNTATIMTEPNAVGDVIYVRTGDYNTRGIVTAVNSTQQLDTDIVFINTTTGGGFNYINLNTQRTNYRIDVFFFDTDDVKFFTEGTEYQPDEAGFLRIDTSSLMRSFLEAEYVNNQNQENISLLFYIEVIERFSGTASTPINDQANPVGLLLASKQLLDEFGSIMKEQTPVVTQDAGGFVVDNQAEFLTRFAEPTLWIGFPNYVFGLSNGDNVLSGAEAFVRETALDINRATISSLVKNFTGTKDEINRISLDQSRLDGGERFRLLEVGLGVSLKAVIDFINASGVPGTPVSSLREAGTVMESPTTSYVRNPVGTGPDSLLEIATFLDELP